MRVNLPVSPREYPFPTGKTLVSTTDTKGRILYCNAAFIEVSGYERQELLGQPHSMIRHPDMPEEAFRDMWATISAGLPWSALVENRRKNGEHDWVIANATPLFENGQPVGYMSVRTEASRAQIQAAETLYAGLGAQLLLALAAMWLAFWALGEGLQDTLAARAPTLAVLQAALVLALWTYLVRTVISPLQGLVTTANQLAGGEITQVIEDSAAKVAQDHARTDAAQVTMGEAVSGVQRMRAIASEISHAADEQLAGISQINAAVAQLDTITQQNAALVEEVAASAQALNLLAENTTETVRVFKIDALATARTDAMQLRRQVKGIALAA